MKNTVQLKTLRATIPLLAGVWMLTSCSINEQALERASQGEKKNGRSSGVEVISHSRHRQRIEREIQTDYDFIMMDHITISDGRMILIMSKDLADRMRIPKSVYQKYLRYVDEYNRKNEGQ